MLPGLSTLEIGRLRMSVGYSTHKRGRPLSPTEVGELLDRSRTAGASLADCAKALGFKGTSQISRFLSILSLSPEILHLISWGRSSDSIGFTTAVELARIPDPDDQRAIARAILEQGLQTGEVRQAAQIRRRSGRPIDECLREVVGMRPVIERVYVFMGVIADKAMKTKLASQTQEERNRLLRRGLEALGIEASGRLGDQFYTIVGGERLNSHVSSIGAEVIESQLKAFISESISNA